MPIVLKSVSLNLLEPSGPVQACNGISLPLPPPSLYIYIYIYIYINTHTHTCVCMCIDMGPTAAVLRNYVAVLCAKIGKPWSEGLQVSPCCPSDNRRVKVNVPGKTLTGKNRGTRRNICQCHLAHHTAITRLRHEKAR